MNRKSFLSRGSMVLLLLIAIAASTFLAWRSATGPVVQPPAEIEDYLFWEARELRPFTLIGAGNKLFTLDNLEGKWSFIFFGYTHCPDICPATLNVMGEAFHLLKSNPTVFTEIQGIFVSVDPKRDTPETLKKYVSYFDDSFSGVTGSTAQINAFTRQMGALYSVDSEKDDDAIYEVTHNSTIFLVDPQGRLYGRFPPPQIPQAIADTFTKIHTFYHKQAEKRWSLF